MSYQSPQQFADVTVTCKANIYFDGGVISHTLLLADGSKKTIGIIAPGSYHFGTAAPERMEIIAGECKVRLAGSTDWIGFTAGTWFDVAGNSAFDIAVEHGFAEYVCSFL